MSSSRLRPLRRRLGRTKAVGFVGKHTIAIADWGSVAAPGPADALPRLDDSKIADILLRVVLKRKPPPMT